MPCARIGSAIVAPIRARGSSDVVGSWNTICTSRRYERKPRLEARPATSRPSRRIAPEATGTRRRRARAIVVLPDPLSPTSAKPYGPAGSRNETPSTARTGPNSTTRSSTSSSGVSGASAGALTPSPRRSSGPPRRGASCSRPRGSPSTRAVGPSSTIRPSCMTATRSQSSAITARSWLMNRTLIPRSSRTRRRRSRISAWTVTSSALVGSSASSTSERSASAIAIAIRCACPPESSWGYRRSRSGDRSTSRNASDARSDASRLRTPCSRSVRSKSSPTSSSGSSEDTGLWKIIETRLPRSSRSRLSGAPTSSSPSRRTLPSTLAPRVDARPSTASAVIDLPEPLSPARPRISPEPSSRRSRSTTRRGPNAIRRSCSESFAPVVVPVIASSAPAWDPARRAGRRRAG